ncbi:hypothetical protein GA0004736_1013 [Curtobacterium sp. 9128]|uniref:GNAT family N-acetyltransferase n=1 Tax=Curtobacterium sp. 9128 TaxID=1793722 RepID=UPI0007D727EE|nr:hypothetical protein [Curtobacterium sp. 9128]SBN62114.1 hypothetical protein GA0004736_1013 [Curtobacterium sp. 9128]
MHAAVVERWVAGWARSRSMPFEADGSGWHVTVGAETRLDEYVVAEPSGVEALRLARAVAPRSTSWLTVVGGIAPDALAALGSLDRMARPGTVMEARLAPVGMPADVVVDTVDGVAFLRIEVDGVRAARGQVALVGRDAVFDCIETEEPYRRRGLGGQIVAGLTAWAVSHGADTGLLVASDEGRALYRTVGWRDVAPVVTYRGFA